MSKDRTTKSPDQRGIHDKEFKSPLDLLLVH